MKPYISHTIYTQTLCVKYFSRVGFKNYMIYYSMKYI